MRRPLYFYMMTNWSRTLYAGVCNNLPLRVDQHRSSGPNTFCGKYRINRLVYVEEAGCSG
jgi:predicted GIY-YIG superfamily endonuclease